MKKYYFGNPDYIIKIYLMGTLESIITINERHVKRSGEEAPNVVRQRQLLDAFNALFEPVNINTLELIHLRYVGGLSVSDTAKHTGLTYYQVQSRVNKITKQAKAIMLKA